MTVLRKAQASVIWNAAAYALRELGDPRAAPVLVEKIIDPATKGNRATLLYALASFDCNPYVEDLVDWVINDNFEVSRKAFQIVEDIEGDPDPGSVATARANLAVALQRTDLNRNALIRIQGSVPV